MKHNAWAVFPSLSGLLKTFVILIGLLSVSCGDQKTNIKIPNVNGPTLDLSENNIIIDAEFLKIDIGEAREFNIPSFTDSKITLTPNGAEGTKLKVLLSLEEILGDVDFRDPQTLPGGRALPGVATGTLPGVSFTIPSFHDITVYVGKDYFGVFYPLDFRH